MSTIVRNTKPATGSPSGERPRPLAYLVPAVAPGGAVAARGPALQLAAVLEEVGWRTVVGNGGVWPARAMADRDVPPLDEAQLIVCVLPGADWLPSAELAIAATRGVTRIVLTAAGEILAGPAADVVDGAEVLRYAPRRAGEALHTLLRAHQTSGDELVAARAARRPTVGRSIASSRSRWATWPTSCCSAPRSPAWPACWASRASCPCAWRSRAA